MSDTVIVTRRAGHRARAVAHRADRAVSAVNGARLRREWAIKDAASV